MLGRLNTHALPKGYQSLSDLLGHISERMLPSY
jgi:hypothetical protein